MEKAGGWKREARSRALAHRLGFLSKTPPEEDLPTRSLMHLSATVAQPLMLSLSGSSQSIVVRKCWASATASFMADLSLLALLS